MDPQSALADFGARPLSMNRPSLSSASFAVAAWMFARGSDEVLVRRVAGCRSGRFLAEGGMSSHLLDTKEPPLQPEQM